MENIKISTEYIKLDQFLKFVGRVSNGGEAKMIIADGLVLVNDEIERRRGKKLRPGDRIKYGNYEYIVI
jgi:ribosome-associated protein